jgi:ubiquinone/menaquinone biosynthesis C-methylase UbiE
MTNTVERFSDRVANYVKYRPGYPPAVLQLFRDEMGLTVASVIADVGSGPGVSARMFVENGNHVYGVEPNDVMRAAAEQILKDFPNFHSIKGTAESTTLPAASVDIVTAAQAFHWFDRERTANEFERILKPGGYVALIWNERQLNSTPFLREYEQFILDNANDYGAVRHENITEDVIGECFHRQFKRATFENVQVFDFDGLRGRMFSASYMPAENTERGRAVEKDLHRLFTDHQENGRITILYDTSIFYSKL